MPYHEDFQWVMDECSRVIEEKIEYPSPNKDSKEKPEKQAFNRFLCEVLNAFFLPFSSKQPIDNKKTDQVGDAIPIDSYRSGFQQYWIEGIDIHRITNKLSQRKNNFINAPFFPLVMEWPILYGDQLLLGSEESEAAIITLWTKKEAIAHHLDKKNYRCIGQLYSRYEGISSLVRNFLANKNIRHLVITGADLSHSGEALVDLFEKGIDDHHRVISKIDSEVDQEIPVSAIDNLRKHVTLHDYRRFQDMKQLNRIIGELPSLGSYGEPEVFPLPAVSEPDCYPAESAGFRVEEKYINDAWLHILHTVMRFGVIKHSQYGVDTKEVMNLIAIISEEDPDKLVWKDFFPFTKKELEEYLPQVLSGKSLDGVSYTYGQRLMDYKGVDQVQWMVGMLKKSPETRRAVAITWDVSKDHDEANQPCLDLVQALIHQGRLHLTVYFRSNDMFAAWPRNVIAIRKLQKNIAAGLDVPMGTLTTISNSAHIYEKEWKKAQGILEKNAPIVPRIGVPRGNIVIHVMEGKIHVYHLTPVGKKIKEYVGTTAFDLFRKIAEEKVVSQVSHALYLGTELQKAEQALKSGMEYHQDQ